MRQKIELFRNKLGKDGFFRTLNTVILVLVKKVFPVGLKNEVFRRKFGDKLVEIGGANVRYGLFKGLKLRKDFVWSRNDLASMLLGLYESQIVERLPYLIKGNKHFVELGSADGFYAAGILRFTQIQDAFLYEKSEGGRNSTKVTLQLNEINKPYEILGEATMHFVDELIEKNVNLSQTFILCDIEGYEVEIFSSHVLQKLSQSTIVIEMHEWRYPQKKLENMISDFIEIFDTEIVGPGPRNLDQIPEVQHLPDNLRWSLCSEGRRKSMQWLIATPKRG